MMADLGVLQRLPRLIRSEEHTSELQSHSDLVCRLLLEKKQEAHEAVRPTDAARTPEDVSKYLDDDLFKLYQLIWQRFVASQMLPAAFDQPTIDLSVGD